MVKWLNESKPVDFSGTWFKRGLQMRLGKKKSVQRDIQTSHLLLNSVRYKHKQGLLISPFMN